MNFLWIPWAFKYNWLFRCKFDWLTKRQTFYMGYHSFLGKNLVSWKIRIKNKLYYFEAEYQAMANTACELVWQKSFIHELGFNVKTLKPIYYDSQVPTYIASNRVFYERTNHPEVDYHFFSREEVMEWLISTPFKVRKSASRLRQGSTKESDGYNFRQGGHNLYPCSNLRGVLEQ